jgi:hypothetical protein
MEAENNRHPVEAPAGNDQSGVFRQQTGSFHAANREADTKANS